MKPTLTLLATLLLAPLAALHATDIELTETLQLPECHSVNWVRDWVKDHPELAGAGWEQLHDASKPLAKKLKLDTFEIVTVGQNLLSDPTTVVRVRLL